jgi:multiple sugar transport system permease protein
MTEARHRPRRLLKVLRRLLLHAGLIVVGFTMALPFLWMLSTSLKTRQGAVEYPPVWIPRTETVHALYDGQSVPVRVLSNRATVKRLDTGEELTVYEQALTVKKPWWNPFATGTLTVPVPSSDGRGYHRVLCEPVSLSSRVRILEEGPDYNLVVALPTRSLTVDSQVQLLLSNYAETWKRFPFGRAYINTFIMAIAITFGQVLTSSLAAFAFARLRFRGRDKLFLGYLATMMIPGVVTMIPLYVLFITVPEVLNSLFSFILRSDVQWFTQDFYLLGKYYVGRLVGQNSYFALIAPGLFSAYGTFLLRQFFMGLPRDLEDAARIDGCGNLRVWWHVTLPLSWVALATLATFTFMASWKAFMWPLIMTNRVELLPLQVLLSRLQGRYTTEYTMLMAGSILVLVPILIVFLFGQRYFVKGIQLGGVKG